MKKALPRLILVIVPMFLHGVAFSSEIDIDRRNDPVWEQATLAIQAKNFVTAEPLLRDLANRGSRRAATFLGVIYAQGMVGAAPDFAKARRWWIIAAKRGSSQAQRNLAVSYLKGDGGPPDEKMARHWLREAADRSNTDAMIELGRSLLSDQDVSQHAEGYMYLRIARHLSPTKASIALGASLSDKLYPRGSLALMKLRRDAVDLLWVSSLADPANLLHSSASEPLRRGHVTEVAGPSADRDERIAYHIDFFLRSMFLLQDRVGHPSDSDPGAKTPDAFHQVTTANARMMAAAGRRTIGRPLVLYPFYVEGTRTPSPTGAYLSATEIWSIVRPGDLVYLSDLFSSHMTTVFSVDRQTSEIAFVDPWPDDIFLLEGRNLIDAKAHIRYDGESRRLVILSREEFIQVINGISTVGDEDFPEIFFSAIPHKRMDARIQLTFAQAFLSTQGCEHVRRTEEHLTEAAALLGEVPSGDSVAAAAIADRLAFLDAFATTCGIALRGPEDYHRQGVSSGDLRTLTGQELQVMFAAFLEQGRVDRAESLVDKIRVSYPNSPEWRVFQGLFEIETNALNEATESFDTAIEEISEALEEGQKSQNTGVVADETQRRLFRMLELAYRKRAETRRESDPSAALRDFLKAVELRPTIRTTQTALNLAEQLGDAEAVQALRQRLENQNFSQLLEMFFAPGSY